MYAIPSTRVIYFHIPAEWMSVLDDRHIADECSPMKYQDHGPPFVAK